MKCYAMIAVFLLCGCNGGGVPTGTATVRAPVVSVAGRIGMASPRCDGRFDGRLTIQASWPAGRGNRVGGTTDLTQMRSDNLTITMMDLNDVSISASGPDPFRDDRQIEGNLTNVCMQGTFDVQGRTRVSGLNPPRPDDLSSTGAVNVRAVGFQI